MVVAVVVGGRRDGDVRGGKSGSVVAAVTGSSSSSK